MSVKKTESSKTTLERKGRFFLQAVGSIFPVLQLT